MRLLTKLPISALAAVTLVALITGIVLIVVDAQVGLFGIVPCLLVALIFGSAIGAKRQRRDN